MAQQNEQAQGNLPTEDLSARSVEDLPVATGKGKAPLTISETEKILQNMQRMIDERQSGLNTILGALKDATAWAGGGIHGPAATLAARDRQRQLEQKELLDMQMEMARFRGEEAKQRRFAEEQAGAYTIPGVSKVTAGEAKQISGTPDVSIEEGQVLYKGYPIDRGTAMLMKEAQTREARDKIFQSYVEEANKKRLGFEYDPNALKTDITMKVLDENGKVVLEKFNARDAKVINDIARRQNIPLEVAARQYLDGRYGRPTEAPARPAQAAATVGGGVTPAAVKQVESGGREGLVSRAGAQGVMQVMPNTQKDPGFGVRPARDDSPAELERVGVDYFNAMKAKYGNDTLAAIAYNMGPAKTDAWLKKGGNFKDLPKETQEYIPKVYLAQAQMDRQSGAPVSTAPAEQAPRPAARKTTPTMLEMESEIESQKAGSVKEAEKRGEEFGTQAIALESSKSNAGERLNSVEYIRNQMNNTNVIGILSKGTVAAALGTLLKEGITTGGTQTSIAGLDQAIAQAMKGSSDKDIAAMQNIAREFAKMELTESRNYLKGQGAVSDMERRLITRIVSSVGTNPMAIKDYLKFTEMRANFDDKAGEAWENFQRKNPNARFNDFKLNDPEFRRLKQEYLQEMRSFTASTANQPSKAQPAKPTPKWSHTDEEYNAWKKSKGL